MDVLPLPVTDPVLVVAITMGILLVGPLLFEKLRLPGLVGLIALGAVAGPSVTGLLERDVTFTLLGTFGLLYLMFIAGVTLDLGEFKKARTQAIAFGALSFAMPMALALGAGRAVLGYGWPAALLLGSIVGSHTLLALPIAGRLGITKNRALVIATGATLVTDLLSLVILAVVQGIESGTAGVAFWLRFAGLSAVWAAAVMLGLPRVARAFFRRVRREDDAAFAFLLAAVFLSAWLAALVGLAPIIGAFLAGIALNRLVPKRGPLMTRLRFVGDAILVPFFLVSVGLLVDVRVLGSAEVWTLAGVFAGLVILGKGGAALLGIPLFGFGRDEAGAVAGLTMPQAAATLAVTLIGFDIGLFSQGAVNAVVLLIVITSLLGPSLMTAFGRRVAEAEAERPYEPADAPERILVPLANPETAQSLMELALLVRSPTSEEPVFPLAIARGEGDGDVAAAERLMERAVLHATAADVPVSPTVRIDANAGVGIVRGLREVRASEVVAGWSGRATPGALVFGGVIDGVLAETRAMVILAHLVKPMGTAKRLVVLCPPSLSREPGFARAVRMLKVLASQTGATIRVLAEEAEAETVQERFDAARPQASTTVRPLGAWREAVDALDDLVASTDVLVMLAVRSGALAWRPSLQRLPRVLVRRFPDNDLLATYLSEAEVEALLAEAMDGDGHEDLHLPAEHVSLGLEPAAPEGLLRQMLYPAFPEHPADAARHADTLVECAGDGAPEVMPGVVFYHAHGPDVAAPVVAVGVCPEGAPLPHTALPARVVVALLAPVAMPRDAYLRLLAVVAQLVRSEEMVEALIEADSPEEARQLMLDGLRSR